MSLPGNPSALSERAEAYVRSAEAIADAARLLNSLAAEGTSVALDAIRERAATVATGLTEAHGRYSGTASALKTYAVELAAAQLSADRATTAAESGYASLARVNGQLQRADFSRIVHESHGSSEQVLEQVDDELRQLHSQQSSAESTLASANASYDRARDELEEAAQRAIAAIDSAISDSNDGFWDKAGKFAEDVGAFFATIGAWIVDFLATVVQVLLVVIAVVIAAILIVLLVAVLILVIQAVLAVVLAILTSAAFWIAVAAAVAIVATAFISRVVKEANAPTPTLTPYSSTDASEEESDFADDSLAQKDLNSVDDFILAEGFVDQLGGTDETVVDIKNMGGEPPNWVVTLPSTQDWQIAGGFFDSGFDVNDDGKVNDLDSNMILMYPELMPILPAVATQYERAVLAAMEQAGISSTDPVMLVGFSQGGIMAGHLATTQTQLQGGDFNVTAVLAYGAPIDGMNIPKETTVVSLQHDGDIVHTLDLTDPSAHSDKNKWVTYEVDPNTSEQPHNNEIYRATATDLIKKNPGLNDSFANFYGPVVEQKQYAFSEAHE
ncbi:hypothetical protein [Cryobacterium sp. W22_MBD10_FK3]|uniref:hypothetical protein n=1 Tax=Cryobacterium sp. W22_MBD10_FK3 TaxID=3240273 RepID=UPI003F93D585